MLEKAELHIRIVLTGWALQEAAQWERRATKASEPATSNGAGSSDED